MSTLADTSVWVQHFRQADHRLAALMQADLLLMHPMVMGELACGTPPQRGPMLRHLGRLRQTNLATGAEVIDFIDREKLFGRGCGLVDLTLLASTLMTPGARLWTLDMRLADLAGPLGVLYVAEPLH